MKLVDLESPFAGDIERNLRYARACMRDSIHRGEAPIASHLLYTQHGILDDDNPHERELGIRCGKLWAAHAELTVVYTDLGISEGMRFGIKDAIDRNRPVEFREFGDLDTWEHTAWTYRRLEAGRGGGVTRARKLGRPSEHYRG